MKSKIMIEIETKGFNKINSEEDLSGEDITEEFEKDFHIEIFRQLKRALEEKDGELYESLQEVCLDGTDIGVEGFECLDDYAKEFKIKVIEVKK